MKTLLSIICTLLISASLSAQTKIERYYNGNPAKQYTLDAQGNYHGAYTEWTIGGKVIMKANYSHGDLHGSYVIYFSNGAAERECMYNRGNMTSLKRYEYVGGKRYLMRSETWTTDGQLLTQGMRLHSDYTGLGEWKEYIGKLPNGTWTVGRYTGGAYEEKYNNNDTVYVWFDRDKASFLGKIHGSAFVYEYDEEGNVLKSPEKTLTEELERKRQDSITFAVKLAEQRRLEEEQRIRKAKQDSILLKRQADYQGFIHSVRATDSLYATAISLYAKNNEHNLYKFLCKQIRILKSKKKYNAALEALICSVFNIDNVTISAIIYEPVLTTEGTTIISYPSQYTYYFPDINDRRAKGSRFGPFLNANKTLSLSDEQVRDYIMPDNIRRVFEKQKLLIEIMEYCNRNAIIIK